MKILVVDDASFVRMALGQILMEDGHEIVGEAADGVEAIEKYKLLKPDLVTMDITMPVMGGIDSLKGIIQFDPNAKVIMCSSLVASMTRKTLKWYVSWLMPIQTTSSSLYLTRYTRKCLII